MRQTLLLTALTLTSTLFAGCFKYEKPNTVIQAPPAAGAFPHELLDKALAGRVDTEGLIVGKNERIKDPEKFGKFLVAHWGVQPKESCATCHR